MSTGLGEIYEFYLASKTHTPMELRTLLDWVVAIKLRSVPGVVEVNGMGGEAKQYQVVLDPQAAGRLPAVAAATCRASSSGTTPSIGAGYIEKNRESFVIRADAQFHSIEEIENTVVTSDADGTPVLIKHLGEVRVGPALRFGAVTKHGEGEIVAGTVMMLIGANSREVVHAVKARLAEIQKELPAGVEIRSLLRPRRVHRPHAEDRRHQPGRGRAAGRGRAVPDAGQLARRADRGAGDPAGDGHRACIGMVRLGVTGNLMSLGAIDFGLLVDGAIVMLEVALVEIARAARRRRARTSPTWSPQSMGKAARPVAFSLLIILLVYLPLMALEGVEGRMFKPMAITVALALGGALLFSLTAFPALAASLLRAVDAQHDDEQAGSSARASARYDGFLRARARRAAAACSRSRRRRWSTRRRSARSWAPSSFRGSTRASCRSTSSGCRRSRSPRRSGWACEVEEVLARFPEVKSIVTRTGRAEVATDPVGPDETEVMVKLRPKEEWTTAHDLDELGEAIKQAVEGEVPATFVVGVAADRGSRQPAAGRLARRRRHQGVRPGPRRCSRGPPTRSARSCATSRGAATGACSACWVCRCWR